MYVDPDQIQAFNPLFIMIFLPLITAFWSFLDVRGYKVRATDKIMGGFVLTAVAMALHVVAAYLVQQSGVKVSLWWQVIAYLVLTWAEILISVTGLELAFAAAQKEHEGLHHGLLAPDRGNRQLLHQRPGDVAFIRVRSPACTFPLPLVTSVR